MHCRRAGTGYLAPPTPMADPFGWRSLFALSYSVRRLFLSSSTLLLPVKVGHSAANNSFPSSSPCTHIEPQHAARLDPLVASRPSPHATHPSPTSTAASRRHRLPLPADGIPPAPPCPGAFCAPLARCPPVPDQHPTVGRSDFVHGAFAGPLSSSASRACNSSPASRRQALLTTSRLRLTCRSVLETRTG